MTWVDQIVEVTGWRGEPVEYGWDREEAELDVTLPSDFKELSRRFPAGTFYAYLDLLRADNNPHPYKLLGWHRQSLTRLSQRQSRLYEPYGLFQANGRPGSSPGGWTSATGRTTGWRIETWIRTCGPCWPALTSRSGTGST